MAPLLLKIQVVKARVTKSVQFDKSTTIYDACQRVRYKVPEAAELKQPDSYGLFLPSEDLSRGMWLQPGRTLEYYGLKTGHTLEYRTKQRPLRVRTLDGAVKTLLVDDSQTVFEITRAVCARIGLHNFREFSFTVDDESSQWTLRRHAQHEHDKQLETLRREQHTDDILNWLEPQQTLREQGLTDETTVVTLRKRFFFSDQNVNANDPVQLRLLYEQCHEAVVGGTHPVTRDESIQLAALQCQVLFGDFKEERFEKKSFLKPMMKELLPEEYRKDKAIVQLIHVEHRKLFGLTELNAKFRYVELCRSLQTYGVSFFAVKEKVPGRNKLRPVLLGISREGVMRLDTKTKAVLQTWPLTTILNYPTTPSSFSLDFGAYAERPYTVKTSEGEAMKQLLDGYIDLILQTRKAVTFQLPEDTQMPTEESYIGPGKSTMIKITPGGPVSGEEGEVAPPPGEAHTAVVKEEPPAVQKALDVTITKTLESITKSSELLSTATELPSLVPNKTSAKWKRTTVEVSRHSLQASVIALLTASSSVVIQSCASPQDTDYSTIGAAVASIGMAVTGATESSRLLAALSLGEEDQSRILDASRALATAMAALLNASRPENYNKSVDQLVVAAGDVSTSSTTLLRIVEAISGEGKTPETAGSLAKKISSTVAVLMAEARKLEAGCDEPTLKHELIISLKNVESSLQGLSLSVVLLSPHADSPLCQERLMEACRALAASIEQLCLSAKAITEDTSALRDLGGAAATVTETLTALLQWIREGSQLRRKEKLEEAYEALLAEAGALQTPITDRKEILKHAKALVEATKLLMQALKSRADKDDHDSRRRLLNAIKELASATSKMAQLAMGVATSPDRAAIGELRKEAEHMVAMATSIVAPSLRQVAVRRLQASSKQATSAAVLLLKTCHEAAESITSEPTQSSLLKQCKLVSEQVTALVQVLQTSLRKPEDTQAEVELVNTSKAFITPTGLLVAAAKKAVPVVGEEAVAVQLGNMAKYTATRLGELRSAVAKAAAFCGSLVIDSAIQYIQELSTDLTHSREEAKEGQLHPLPGQSVESCFQELLAAIKTMESLKCQLLGAVADKNGSNAGFVAREMVENLEVMVEAVCRLAAGTESQEMQDSLFESAANVLNRCEMLLTASKLHLEKKDASEEQSGLLDAARALSDALKQLLNYLPGQIEYEKALKSLQDAARALDPKKLPDTGDANYSELETQLTAAAAALIASLKELLAAAKGAPMEQRMAAVSGFTQTYQEFLRAGIALAAVCQKKDDQSKVLSYLQSTSTSSNKLLLTAKLLSVDPTQGQGQLTAAARSLIDAMNKLLTFCSASRPVLKECKGALLDVQTAGTLLDNTDEPISDLTYYGCIDATDKNIKVLSEVLAMLSDQVASGDHEELAHSVLVVGGAVCEVVEAAAQASYLVGVADPTSIAAVPGLVDQGQLARMAHMISSTCQTFTNPASTQTEVIVASGTVSKLSTTVCGICKVATTNTGNALVSKEFRRFMTRMTDSTATLLECTKKLGEEPSDKHRQSCDEATKPLLDTLEELIVFTSSAKFTSSPAKISQEGQRTQQPLTECGQVVVRSTTSLLTVIMDHVSSTEVQKLDEEGKAVFVQHAKTFLDGLQILLNAIRDNCLGLKKLDEEGRAMFSQYAKTLLDALQTLLNAIRDNCPGLKECDAALTQLKSVHKQLDQASHKAMQHTLQENASSSLQGFLKQLIETAGGIGEAVQPVTIAAKLQVDKLGKQVTTLVRHFPLLAQVAIGAVSKVATSNLQHKLLDHSSTVVEAAVHLVTIAREVRGNPHNYEGHKKVDQWAKLLQEAVGELTEVAEDICNKNRLVGGMVGELLRALGRLEERPEGEENDGTFAEHQTKVLQQCEAIASAAHDMVVKGSVTPDSLAALRRKLITCYTNLVDGTQGAVATMENVEDHLDSLYQAVQALGEAVLRLLYSSAAVQVHPEDQTAHSELAQHANQVKTKVSQVVLLFQTCGMGTHACLKGLAAIRELIGDIETTTTLFSTTSALHLPAAEQGESFGQYRDEILKAARAVTEATQSLVQSAKGPQGELAKAVSTALETLTSQAELVKKGVQALPAQNMEGKLLLLNAVKDVAHTLEGVMEASAASSGRRDSHPSTQQLKISTKHAEVAGAQLVKAVDSAASASGSGAQTLQNAIDYIGYILEDFDTQVPWIRKEPSYQDLVHSTRGLSFASAKAVFAGRLLHLEDIAVCASMGKRAVSELLATGAALAWSAELEEDKARILKVTRNCAFSFKSLLEHIQQLITEPTDERKEQLPRLAEEVTDNIQELWEAAKELRDELSSPELSVEMNLPAAVTSINSAAEQISALHPTPTVMTDADTVDYNYEILEDVKKTAKACSSLVELAIAVHQELMPLEQQRSQLDEEWSHSMLAAAQGLASEASGLCETSNMYMHCYASEEKITAAAQSVAGSMSRLLLVALSKMEAGSEYYQKIQLAAAAIKQCTDSLINTAENALLQIEDDPYALMQSPVASMGQFRPCLGRKDSEIIRIQEDMERTGKVLTKIQLEWI